MLKKVVPVVKSLKQYQLVLSGPVGYANESDVDVAPAEPTSDAEGLAGLGGLNGLFVGLAAAAVLPVVMMATML